MLADTGGAGRHRGGLGLVREYEILSDEAILNVRSDKRRFPPHGLFGGGCAPSPQTERGRWPRVGYRRALAPPPRVGEDSA